jgi:hypothetical protein
MEMKPGMEVMCVKDLNKPLLNESGLRVCGFPLAYPKLHEELIVDEVGEWGLRFYRYDNHKLPTYWPFDAFVPTTFMQDEIGELMESVNEEVAA